jgi:hypothetical protein
MATSDGIPSEDWDVIHQHALDCANASLRGDERGRAEGRRRMLASLERLETKFGRLPSILSTRADYVDDLAIKEALFIEAYEGAARSGDELNQLLTAHSLAELYIDDHRNASKGRVWLTTLRVHITELDEPDAQFDKDYSRMARALMKLDS